MPLPVLRLDTTPAVTILGEVVGQREKGGERKWGDSERVRERERQLTHNIIERKEFTKQLKIKIQTFEISFKLGLLRDDFTNFGALIPNM